MYINVIIGKYTTVEGITVQNCNYGIQVDGQHLIKNITFFNNFIGIRVSPLSPSSPLSPPVSNSTIYYCHFENNTDSAIVIGNLSSVEVIESNFFRNRGQRAAIIIDTGYCYSSFNNFHENSLAIYSFGPSSFLFSYNDDLFDNIISIISSQFVAENSVFHGNPSNNIAGGLFCGSPYQPIILNNCSFHNNMASSISLINTILIMENCTFDNNTAEKGAAILSNTVSTVFLKNCNFTNNTATISGGAVHTEFRSLLNISDCHFWKNSGGAIYGSQYSEIVVESSSFMEHENGTIITSYSNLKILSSQFGDNKASEYGGAICVTNGNVTIDDIQCKNNSAKLYGGCLYINSTKAGIHKLLHVLFFINTLTL